MLKNELKDLISNKSLLILLFFGILFLDAFGAMFPNILNRQVTLFLPLPIIFVNYLLKANRKNKWFLLSLVLNFLGIVNFNTVYETYGSLGLWFHSLAFFCYIVILVKHYSREISLKRTFVYSAVIVCLVTFFLVLYAKGIKKMLIFYDILLYVLFVTLFVIFAVVLYETNRTKKNRFLLFSAVFIFSSTCFQGYNLFLEPSGSFLFLAIIGLNLTHYFMSKFLLEKEKHFSVITNNVYRKETHY